MAITVTGSNPTRVTVVSETITTDTVFNAGAPNDRAYVLNDSIVGTINAGAIVRGFGLRLETTEVNGGVAITNNESIFVSGPIMPALELIGNGGAVTYAGSGTITNNVGAALRVTNNGSGSASVAIGGDIKAGPGQAVSITTQNGSITFTQAAGTRIDNIGPSGATGVEFSTGAGAIVANLNGAIIREDGAGIAAISNSGSILINMTGGQIGSVDDRPFIGIVARSNAPVNDITITAINIFSSDTSIDARMTNAAATGDIAITINGTVNSDGFAVVTFNEGTGRIAVTVNGTVIGAQGISVNGGPATVVNSGTITGTFGRAVGLGDGNDTYNGVNGLVTGTISGGAGNDTLRAGGGNNSLLGENGNDVLDGGVGNDIMTGAAGNDIYTVDRSGDVIVEVGGQGLDRLLTAASYVLASGVSIEVMATLSSGATTAINLTGNELVNSITGNAGNNVLDGRDGADTLQGLGGSDSYFVDTAGDKVLEVAGQGTDTVYAAASYVLAAGVSVETLRTINAGVTTAINLTGNNLANTVIGNVGHNAINGGGGADTLHGGFGNDSYYVDNALDKIVETAGRGTDNVNAAVSYTLAAGVSAENSSARSMRRPPPR